MGLSISKLRDTFPFSVLNGFQTGNENEDCWSDNAHFLDIPVEIRETILSQLRPRDRQMLRVVCRQLANEIDHLVGPVNFIYISDFRYSSYISYFSKVYVPSIKINGLCISQTFTSIVTYPSRLKSFTLSPEGIACALFISHALKYSTNLITLNLSGKMKGLLNPFEDKLHFPKMSSLTLNSNNFHLHPLLNWESHIQSFIDVLNGRSFDVNMVMAFWHNQSTLLRLISAPNLEDATLFLHTFANAPDWEEISEKELMAQLLQFLGRHKVLKRLKITHGQRSLESRLFEYRTQTPRPPSIFSSGSEDNTGFTPGDLISSSRSKLVQFLPSGIQEFEFCSSLPSQFEDDDLHGLTQGQNQARQNRNLPETCFEHYILNLLKSLRGLTHLKFSGTKGRSFAWTHFAQIISSHAESLIHVEIVGKLIGPINFDVLSQCRALKVIMINNRQRHRMISPVIENFFCLITNPYLGDNLETLVFQNIGLKSADFQTLHYLRKLSHLAIYRWRCIGDEHITQEGIKSALSLPCLKSLLLPWPKVVIVPNLVAAMDHLLELEERFGFGSKCFLHPKDGRKMGVTQYICIEEHDGDPASTPLWRRTGWGFKIRDNFHC